MPSGGLPVVVTLAGVTVLVVGGGAVGRRRAAAAAAAGAVVRGVDPEPPADEPPGVTWLAEAYRRDHLAGVALAFAAGPPDVNAVVVADARAAGVWVCSATAPGTGTFTLPATVRRGMLTLA